MSKNKLIKVSYCDLDKQVRLSALAITIVLERDVNGSVISVLRFGGYPTRKQAVKTRKMADVIVFPLWN